LPIIQEKHPRLAVWQKNILSGKKDKSRIASIFGPQPYQLEHLKNKRLDNTIYQFSYSKKQP
jgi:hypothetical protein